MKILALSDSHQVQKNMRYVIEKLKNEVQAILFLGDCIEDMAPYGGLSGMEIYSVPGNCDIGAMEPPSLLITLGGKKIFMTHGDMYGVKFGYDRIVYKALEMEADACLFGHTHYPACFYQEGILFMNPGSISLPRGIKYPSYGLLEIENGSLTGAIVGKKGKQYQPITNL